MAEHQLDLWLDSENGEASAGWSQDVVMDFDRLEDDPYYASIIDRHIRMVLGHLAKELEAIGTSIPIKRPQEENCE